MFEWLPREHPTRSFYLELFEEMSGALQAAQQPDGFWYPSLLDPEHVPFGETSGTALFVMGMAWGTRRGHLDVERYWPAVERGWNAISARIEEDGAVTSVQPFGESPVVFDRSSTATFGTGAVLMAGAEILYGLDAAPRVDPEALFEEASAMTDAAPDLSSMCEDCPEAR